MLFSGILFLSFYVLLVSSCRKGETLAPFAAPASFLRLGELAPAFMVFSIVQGYVFARPDRAGEKKLFLTSLTRLLCSATAGTTFIENFNAA